MATCAKDVLDLTDSDVLLMAVSYIHGKNPYRHVSVIGRAKPVKSVDLSAPEEPRNGHPKGRPRRSAWTTSPNATLVKMQEEGHVDGVWTTSSIASSRSKFRRRRRRAT